MRYNQIRECDIANGEGIGVALFVQGCHFHCKNCFNPETWDFNGGKEWTPEVEDKFIELASRPYIKRISLLGGECLADENLDGILNLVNRIRLLFGNSKSIWLYTGYKTVGIKNDLWLLEPNIITDKVLEPKELATGISNVEKRSEIIKKCDTLVDGRYIDSQKDISLKWRGSSNQRVIAIQKSLQKGEIVLWSD